ncbi:unnamed protein product [Amoebophrya sp. A25]|nr:unnamed protein product [Amoebophrya sp. A25]|eukprot:GSA25T00023632001.1
MRKKFSFALYLFRHMERGFTVSICETCDEVQYLIPGFGLWQTFSLRSLSVQFAMTIKYDVGTDFGSFLLILHTDFFWNLHNLFY